MGDGLDRVLVTELLRTAEVAVRADSTSLAGVVEVLRSYPWRVFLRIEIHLLAMFPSAAREFVAERIAEFPRLLDDPNVSFEIARLAEQQFGQLSMQQQDEVLRTVASGPDDRRVRRMLPLDDDHVIEPAYLVRPKLMWIRRRLRLIDQHLPDTYTSWLSPLLGDDSDDPPVEENRSGVSNISVGEISPMTAGDLDCLQPAEVARVLTEWVPSGTFMGATREGLAEVVRDVVSRRATEFAPALEEFHLEEPTYVRAVLQGVRDAVERGIEFPWDRALELCEWAVRQAWPQDEVRTSFDEDPDWGWTRGVVSDLLRIGLRQDRIPLSERTRVWRIIERLLEDPDPAPREGMDTSDALTDSLNCGRGRAMYNAVDYALWLYRAREAGDAAGIDPEGGIQSMPEFQSALERRLDPTVETAPAVRAVHGRHFPHLALLDASWAEGIAPRIFGFLETPLERAAWGGYLVGGRVYDGVFRALRPQYDAAVAAIGSWESDSRDRDADPRLASDLMTLVGRGTLAVDPPDAMLKAFFETASPQLRRRAIAEVGFGLARHGAAVAADAVKRLVRLWEWRQETLAVGGVAESEREELAGFGAWVAVVDLDLDWRLRQLEAVIRLGVYPDRDLDVVEVLASVAGERSRQSAEILSALCSLSSNMVMFVAKRNEVSRILREALGSGDELAIRAARDAIGYLAARGRPDFRSVLDEGTGT